MQLFDQQFSFPFISSFAALLARIFLADFHLFILKEFWLPFDLNSTLLVLVVVVHIGPISGAVGLLCGFVPWNPLSSMHLTPITSVQLDSRTRKTCFLLQHRLPPTYFSGLQFYCFNTSTVSTVSAVTFKNELFLL